MSFLDYHPLANLFPLIEGEAYEQLVDDVRQNGVREPIVLLDGKILDGRNRYRAGLEAGFFTPSAEGSPIPHPQYMFDHFGGIGKDLDPLAWVISKNLNRRHLTDDQRRMVAARVANLKVGRPSENVPHGPITRAQAAQMLSVDERGVKSARAVVTNGAAELQQAVDQRRVTVRMAADLAALSKEQQREIISLSDPRALREAVRDVRQNFRAAVGTMSATREERGVNLYETPPEAVHALLAFETFSQTVWEPSCGKGAISRVLEAAGHEVRLSDLVDYGTADRHGEVQAVQDFLATQAEEGCPDIVTNPPYGGVLNAYVAHALRIHRPPKMALLLNINWLCGFDDPDRVFARQENPPSCIYVLTRRLPMMHRDGWDGPEASSRMNTAWFVWNRDGKGRYGPRTIVKFVDWKEHVPRDTP